LLYSFCAKNKTFAFLMQTATADLIFVSVSGLMFDVYHLYKMLWLTVIVFL